MICGECGGDHESSGARLDCVRHWKLRTHKAENKLLVSEIYDTKMRLLKDARTLLSNATPNAKLIPLESQQAEWAQRFGIWWSESLEILSNP